MSPPPAVTELAPGLHLHGGAESISTTTFARALQARWWLRGRFLVDGTVLSLASTAAVFGSSYLGIARVVLRSIRRHALAFEAFASPTLIVGAGLVGQQLTHRLQEDRTYGLRPVGMIDADPLPYAIHGASGVPVLGGLS